MTLTIVIVSYNTAELTIQAIKSIPRKKDWEIIVVDNASTDDTIVQLKKRFQSIKLIENKKNLGFAVANNQGAAKSQGEYLLFLNSDTIVQDQAIEKMLEFIQQRPDVGATSCRLLNADGSLQPQGGALPTRRNLAFQFLGIDDLPLVHNFIFSFQERSPRIFLKNRQFGWLGGTALMTPKKIFNQLKGFDPDYFMYVEDVDYCYRLRLQGFKTIYLTEPTITHLGSRSSSSRNSIHGEIKNLQTYFSKHFPAKLNYVRPILKLGILLRIILFVILRRKQSVITYAQALKLVKK
jgi:GT2 family glycosyltransferase